MSEFEIMAKDQTTEEKIKEAAKRVFMAKGFAGCSSREIAKEAGMNVALVNYYFRSKSQLFQLIFKAAMEDFLTSMIGVFEQDMELETKLRIFIEREYEFLAKHPELPGFVIGEMAHPELCSFDEDRVIFDKILQTGVYQQAQEAQEAGLMRKIDLVSITLLIMANCQFPFMARPLIKGLHQLTDEAFDQQLLLHKQYVTEMMITYLFPKNNK